MRGGAAGAERQREVLSIDICQTLFVGDALWDADHRCVKWTLDSL